MNVLNYLSTANMVADALSRFLMGSVALVEKENKELVELVHRLAKLGVCLHHTDDNGLMVQNNSKLSLVDEVK